MEEIKIKRPPNAFILFSNDFRPMLGAIDPQSTNRARSGVLGHWWRDLEIETKNEYFLSQTQAAIEHEKLYPDYVYNPNEARKKKALKAEAKKLQLLKKKALLPTEQVQNAPVQHDGGMQQKIKPKLTNTEQIVEANEQKGGTAPKRVKMAEDAESTYQISSVATSTISENQKIRHAFTVTISIPCQPTRATSAGVKQCALTKLRKILPKMKRLSPMSDGLFVPNLFDPSCLSYVKQCDLIPVTEKCRDYDRLINGNVYGYTSITLPRLPEEQAEQNGCLLEQHESSSRQ